jgi:hypothetical protein
VSVSLVIVCPPGSDPTTQTRAALEVGAAWVRVGADIWALTVDDAADQRRAVARDRQRRYRERDNESVTARDNGSVTARDKTCHAVSRSEMENPWSETERDRGVTGDPLLRGGPPVTASPGHAGPSPRDTTPRDTPTPRDTHDTPTPRDTHARHYHQAGDLEATAPLDDLERERARRGMAAARAALEPRGETDG